MNTANERAFLAKLGYDVDAMTDREVLITLERLQSIWESDA